MRRTYRKVGDEWVEVTRGPAKLAAPTVIGDIDKPYITDDGRQLTSRSQVREHMRATGQVPIQEHQDVMKDHVRHRHEFWRSEKDRRRAAVIDAVKGHGS
jgi:hypothetical protein